MLSPAAPCPQNGKALLGQLDLAFLGAYASEWHGTAERCMLVSGQPRVGAPSCFCCLSVALQQEERHRSSCSRSRSRS